MELAIDNKKTQKKKIKSGFFDFLKRSKFFFSFNFFNEAESPPRKSTEKFKLKLPNI